MDEFQILFCICVDGDIRSIYALTESEIIIANSDDDSILEIVDILKSNVNLETDLHIENTNCLTYKSFNVNILEIKPFIETLESSKYYRKCIIDRNYKNKIRHQNSALNNVVHLCNNKYITIIKAKLNDSYVIDYYWGWMLWRDCHIGLERECAAAWLSTLGGAFSALGDYNHKFATMAFHTSMQQIRLARICQDESGIARGWLFLALALSQLGFGKAPKLLLHKAWNFKSNDSRHKNMCLGVQVKLKYDSKMRKLARESGKIQKDLQSDQKKVFWELLKTLKL